MWLTVLITALAVCNYAYADPVEIALPGLAGDYDWGFVPPNDAPNVRTATFVIPPNVQSFEQLIVVMSGTNSEGSVIREIDIGGGQTVSDTLSAVTAMRLGLTADSLGGGCFFGLVNLLEPTFSGESGFVGSCDVGNPLDLNLLLNTTIQAELECAFSPSGDPWLDGLVTLTDVSVRLGGQIVETETSSWGEIKVLYR